MAYFAGVRSRAVYVLTVVFLTTIASAAHATAVLAQTTNPPGGWTAPIDLAAGRTGQNIFPTILADAAGGVHVFWDEVTEVTGGTVVTVDYAYWDGSKWSETIDAFAGSRGPMAMGAQAVIDAAGIMHTVWIDDRGLMYAQRHVASPISAPSWINRQLLPARAGGSIGPLVIEQDQVGVLHVAYLHQYIDQPGIYYLQSADGGATWSDPVVLSEATEFVQPEGRQRYYLDLLATADALHLAWVQPENSISYTRSKDGGVTWSTPVSLPGGIWPNLVALDDGRIAIFSTGALPNGDLGCLKLQITSSDGGQNWSAPRDILQPQIRGCLGRINVMRDSHGGDHLITSAYHDLGTDVERIWYSEEINGNWGTPSVVAWPGNSYEALGKQPDFPSATVAAGNVLHVVFHTDSGRIWHTQSKLAASSSDLVVYPTPAPLADTADRTSFATANQGKPEGAASATSQVEPAPVSPHGVNPARPARSSINGAIAGAMAGASVVLLVVIWNLRRLGRWR